MAAKGLLTVVGNPSRCGGLDGHYLTIGQLGETRRGVLALVSVLAPEFPYHRCKPGLVHITGRNGAGDAVFVVPRETLHDDCRTLTGTVIRYRQASARLCEQEPTHRGPRAEHHKGAYS